MTDTLSIERAKKTKEIMSGYDMTHMSRNEMIEMAGKLENPASSRGISTLN